MIESFWEQNRTDIGKQFLGSIHKVASEGNKFFFYDLNACLMAEVISENIIRIRLAPNGHFLPDFSYALQDFPFQPVDVDFEEADTYYEISTPLTICRITKEGFYVSFHNAEGVLLNADGFAMHWEENVQFGGYNVFNSKTIQEGESFYGLGDKAADLNLLRGRFSLWSVDAYAFERGTDPLYRNIPFYIGLHSDMCYGLFYDNSYKTHFDFGLFNPNEVNYWAEGGELNYYFIQGPHMMDVVKRYAYLTGTAPMPPMWALGFHQCRWSYYPESKMYELAEEFRKREIPCDALYLDIDYMDGYRCFTWNKTHFPEPEKMMAKLKDDGFKTVVILDPGIKLDHDYNIFKEADEAGYLCRRGDDYYMEGPVWPGRCRFPDFTHPDAREWWGTHVGELVKQGVAGVWNDMNEPSVFGLGTFPNDVRHYYEGYRGSHRKAHNVYGMQMARATYDGMVKTLKNKRPFTILRSTYAGGQRYGAAWTGDNIGTWDHLRLAAQQCQRMSMSGFSFVGSDIGGFTGNADAELFVRWMQFGAFSPFMRAHSSGDTIEREPWSYGPETEAIIKKYIELRYQLIPYIYSAFWEHHKFGFPILRPVVMMEQKEPTTWYRQDEYCFGDKLLVCPVLEQGAKQRIVYLPKGCWYNFWNLDFLEGQNEHVIDTPLDHMPLFVRAGSVIPQYPVMQYIGEREIEELQLSIYYAEYAANSFLYEDHGDSFAYTQEIYTEKKFHYEYQTGKVTITQTQLGLHTPRYDNYRVRFIGLPMMPDKVLMNGKRNLGYTQHDENGNLVIEFTISKSFNTLELLLPVVEG